jgi:hypothetical protein
VAHLGRTHLLLALDLVCSAIYGTRTVWLSVHRLLRLVVLMVRVHGRRHVRLFVVRRRRTMGRRRQAVRHAIGRRVAGMRLRVHVVRWGRGRGGMLGAVLCWSRRV